MPRYSSKRLTLGEIRDLPPGDHPDAEVRGLYVRVSSAHVRTFTVRYRLPGGRGQRRMAIGAFGAITLHQARQIARDILSRVAAGEDPSRDQALQREEISVVELVEAYISDATPRLKASSVRNYEFLLRDHITPHFLRMKASKIEKKDVETFLKKASTKSKSRAAMSVTLLRAAFSFGMEKEIISISKNPAAGIRGLQSQERQRYMSTEERSRIWSAIDSLEGRFHGATLDVFRLLILTGARRREISSLRWSEVDFDSRRIVKEEAKTEKRVIFLSDEALEILKKRKSERVSVEWVFPSSRDPAKPVDVIEKAWSAIIKTAGVSDLRIHDLRHSYASDALAAGLPLHTIGILLGHRHHATTARYAHLSDVAAISATELISKTISEKHSRESNQESSEEKESNVRYLHMEDSGT